MFNNLEFILKLKDQLSPVMRQAVSAGDNAANKIKSQFTGIEYSGKKMGASVNELKSRLDSINQIRFSTHIKKEFDAATTSAKSLEKQISRLSGEGSKVPGGGMLGGIVKGNLIAGAISQGIGMIKELGIDTYQTAMKSGSLKTAINSTTGGQGKQAVAQTWDIADKYGLNYEASLEGVKTLTGGLKSMNMPLAEQMKIFEGVSTGISAMKLGAEESKGAMLALGQMASKGVVSAEELRGQLGERIPGAFGIAAKSMNVTEAQLGKMLQKGEVAAKDFLPRFAAEMKKTFGADALAAANGPAAIQERFNNAIFSMKASIGEGLMPVITPIIESFTTLATTILPYIQEGIQYIVSLVSNVSSGTSEWSSYINIVKNYTMSLWVTIKSLVGNIWNIVGGIVEWVKKSELMRDLATGIGKAFEGVLWAIRQLGDAIQWIWENLIKPILDKIEWVYSKIKGLFGGGKTEIVVTDGTKAAASAPVLPTQMQPGAVMGDHLWSLPKMGMINTATRGLAVDPTTLNASRSKADYGKLSAGGLGDAAKGKADGINSGGQRSIVINIGKQIEKLEQHIIGGSREVAEEMEGAIRESLRRVVYSLNGTIS